MNYQFQHSVQAGVGRQAAWDFWTNVDNWALDPAVESVTLDGEFAAGSEGTTHTKGGPEPIKWKMTSVTPGTEAVIEIPLPGAVVRFEWKFEEVNSKRTTLTQKITLNGEKVEDYMPMVGQDFENGVRQGMAKLAAEMSVKKVYRKRMT